MSNSTSKRFHVYRPSYWWFILFPILSLFVELAWKPFFDEGKVIGIYWLFFFVQENSLILAELTIALSLVFFILQFVLKRIQRSSQSVIKEISLTLLLSGFIFIFIFLTVFTEYKRETHHIDELSAQGKIFYLSSFPASSLSVGFGLYECDKYGIFCKQVFRSGKNEYYESDFGAQLMYDEGLNTVKIYTSEYGIIYEYKIP